MKKIFIIALREFRVRTRKRSFKIMTVVGPFVFALMMIIPFWLKSPTNSNSESIYVIDNTGSFINQLESNGTLIFIYDQTTLEQAKQHYLLGDYAGLLFIPSSGSIRPSDIQLLSKKKIPYRIQQHIEDAVNKRLKDMQVSKLLRDHHIPQEQPVSTLHLHNESFYETFENEQGTALGTIGLFLAILIYFFILLYGLQVMRSVMEEKSSRVVEVLISSVKPFQLMMGKILGIAMVSLLQFFIWITSTTSIAFFFKWRFGKSVALFKDENIVQSLNNGIDPKQALEMNEFINSFQGLEPVTLVSSFFIFFICGYLLYSSLFAAIGSLVDSETDLQQFMLPVTLPLFISFMLISVIMEQPHGTLAVWLSIIPLTSPVIMMVRLPYGVPVTELIFSLLMLVAAFITATWCAAKIYRAGILLYGKRISYVEIFKWMFFKGY